MKIIGIVLIVLGVVGIGYGGFRYAYPEKIVDAGPLQVSVTRHESVPIPPILGALALAGGIVLIGFGGRKES